jgi:starch-binding outer membrane protein, SusD/RagB family
MAIKYTVRFLVCAVVLLLAGCEDYLEKKESAALTEDQVFGDPQNFQRYHDDIYTYLHYWPGDWACQSFGGLGRIAYSSFEGATDLAEASRDVAGTNASFNLGNWSPTAYGAQVELIWPWRGAYAAIRRCNVVIERVDDVPELTLERRNGLRAEALFLRAFFHFQLLKRYGGVPYLTQSLGQNDNMDFARLPFHECVQLLVKDLEEAVPFLPLTSEQSATNLGRPTRGAALALKAQALVFAASPLNTAAYDVSIGSRNPDLYFFEQPNTAAEIQEKWERAAEGAWDVIVLAENESQYRLMPFDRYSTIFHSDPNNAEILWLRVDGSWTFSGPKAFTGWIAFSYVHASLGYGGSAGTYPTQNLIDMFEMANGSIPILGYEDGDGTKPIINSGSGYNEQTMWENRDPRLRLTVLTNQSMWQGRPVQLWFDKNNPAISGSEIKDAPDYTTTGYLTRKMWPEELSASGSASVYMNWIFIRYAEVLLWYAESMNHAFGPDGDGLGTGRTARWAIDAVRARVNMPPVVATTKEEFHERLMNERAVEFVYEEKRWWDVLRYKKGVEIFNRPVYGIRTHRVNSDPLEFEITRRRIENRTFRNYMHKYPIPYSEIEKSPKLKQNPGW